MPERADRTNGVNFKSARLVSTGFTALLALTALGMRPGQEAAPRKSTAARLSPAWNWKNNAFYASRMSNPTLICTVK